MEQRLSARKEDLNAATSRVSEMEAQLKELEKAVAEKEENLNKRKLELEVAENEALGAFDAASPGDRGLVVDIQSPGIDPPEPKGLASKSRNDDDGDYHKTSQLEEEVDGLHEMLQQKGERVGMLELEVMRLEEELKKKKENEGQTIQVDDYDTQMGNVAKMRNELKELQITLKKRETDLEAKKTEMEEEFTKELGKVEDMKIEVLKNSLPGTVMGVNFDWCKADFDENPDQFNLLLVMVENWVKGMKDKTWFTRKGVTSNIVEVENFEEKEGKNEETQFLINLTERHVNPLISILEVFRGVVPKALARKLQHVILQVEKFGGFLTPSLAFDEMMHYSEDITLKVERHTNGVKELLIDVARVERQVSKLISQAEANPEMSFSTVRSTIKKWGEKLETFGKILGTHEVLNGQVGELRELQGSFVGVVQNECSEVEMEQLRILEMASATDELTRTISSTDKKLMELIEKKKGIHEQINVLTVEYERANGRAEGRDIVKGFDPIVDDTFVNPDLDDVDPEEIIRLNDKIKGLEAEIDSLKGGKYEKMMESDGSYGGLMFFAFLQETHFEEKLGRIVEEVQQLHDASMGGGGKGSHLSFTDLQKMVDHLAR